MKKIISLLLIISNFFVVLQIPCYSDDENEYYATSEDAYTGDCSNYYASTYPYASYQIVIPINTSAQATADAQVKSTCKSSSSSSDSASAKTWLLLAAALFLAYKLKVFNLLSLLKQNNEEQSKEVEKKPQKNEEESKLDLKQSQEPGLFNKFTNYFAGALAELSAHLTLQGLINFFSFKKV